MHQMHAQHATTPRHTARIAAAFVALAAAASLMGCGDKPPATAVFVLFDLTGCVKDPAIQKRYESGFEQIVATLWNEKDPTRGVKKGAVVMGDKITHNTMATASYPITATLPAFGMMKAQAKVEDEIKAATKALGEQAKALLGEKTEQPNTDLMNAFQLADKVSNGEECSAASQKLLVVFSDMIEQSGRYDFSAIPLNDEAVQKIIAKEREGKRLPKLDGVKVWVAGATASTGAGLSSDRILQIQSFWLTYFKACGADLTKERYAPTLLGFSIAE